jgi:cytochrome P450 family 9
MFEFRKPVYFICDPKLAKKLAVKDFDFFVDRKLVFDEKVDKIFGKSLVSLQGSKWKGEREYIGGRFVFYCTNLF